MKTIRATLAMLALGAAMSVSAQEKLAVGEMFGDSAPLEGKIRTVYLSGANLDGRDMTLFRSILSTGSEDDVMAMGKAAEQDSREATSIKRVVNGETLMALYIQLPLAAGAKDNRFVLFRRMSATKAMLVYIEGPTTLDKIVNVKLKK